MAIAVVRYGAMGARGRFSAPDSGVAAGQNVVARTPRGVEWGELVQVKKDGAPEENLAGEVLRRAGPDDYEKQREITERIETEEYQFCKQLIRKHDLPMKLRGVEHLFGGHKLIFYFLADGRVDFRRLVRDLAKQYRMRIEMRQIGVRDEARLLGLVGPCGHELCCRRFLPTLKPVPMKLAKDQKSTLDPAKISGSCGRLKCCLRFEEKLYRDFKRRLPRRGTEVLTKRGRGTVVDYEVLSQQVLVELREGGCHKFPVSEVQTEQ